MRSSQFDQLYDMAADPFETTNLAKQKPEVFQRLLTAYKEWEKGALAETKDISCSWGRGNMATK